MKAYAPPWIVCGILTGAVLLCSCREKTLAPGQETKPPPAETGTYGQRKPAPEARIAKAQPPKALDDAGWEASEFAVLQSVLSPALLVRTSRSYLGLFNGMDPATRGAPAHVALSVREGPRIFQSQETIPVTHMEECWIVVWFEGSPGWQQWDSPWAVFLQKKPLAIRLDTNGLHLRFRGPAGEVAMMPLYGSQKLPLAESDYKAVQGDKSVPIPTWSEFLPRELLLRVRYWASVTRLMPVYCEERFRINRATDELELIQDFSWHVVSDEWGTRPLKVAPISPWLAMAAREIDFPATWSGSLADLRMVTSRGPYLGVEGADQIEVTFPWLHYVHETERTIVSPTNQHPAVRLAMDRIESLTRSPEIESVADCGRMAKVLPLLPPSNRAAVSNAVDTFLRDPDFWARTNRNDRVLETLWAYAHFTGDWDLIRSHWEQIRAVMEQVAGTRWLTFGPEVGMPMGDDAAPLLALARMAYQVGDIPAYEYACYRFVQSLAHHFGRLHQSDYLKKFVSWRKPPETYAAPDWWLRFENVDVARFHRDYLTRESALALRDAANAWDAAQQCRHATEGMPSLAWLRSVLLNTPPDQQANSPEDFSGTAAAIIASCQAVLRTSEPIRFERLIPKGQPGEFRLGLERESAVADVGLVMDLTTEQPMSGGMLPVWPRPTWDMSAAWDFGAIRPMQEGRPIRVKQQNLSWTTRLWRYDLP